MTFRYSPLLPAAYHLHGIPPPDEVGVILAGSKADAVWNLYWLSIPSIDSVPGAGANWWRTHTVTVGALATIITDVHEDEVLYRKLLMHPWAFSEWFSREDHSIYNTYYVMGGPAWATSVLRRAELAASRMTAEAPPVVITNNVVSVNFRRQA